MRAAESEHTSTVGRESIDAAILRFADHPEIRFDLDGKELRIKGSEDGFDTIVEDRGSEVKISAGPWYTYVNEPQWAALLLTLMQSPAARITAKLAGKRPVSRRLDIQLPDGTWHTVSRVYKLRLYIGKRTTVTLSNSVINAADIRRIDNVP